MAWVDRERLLGTYIKAFRKVTNRPRLSQPQLHTYLERLGIVSSVDPVSGYSVYPKGVLNAVLHSTSAIQKICNWCDLNQMPLNTSQPDILPKVYDLEKAEEEMRKNRINDITIVFQYHTCQKLMRIMLTKN